MLSKYDISRLQDLPIEQVAQALQITVSRHKALCPFHDDSRPSLTFNRQKNRYRCFVCNASGGSIDLVMHSQNWKFYESCCWLSRQFGLNLTHDCGFLEPKPLRQQPKKAHPVPQPVIDLHYLEGLMAHPYLSAQARQFLFDQRKISPSVVQMCGLSSISQPVPMSGNPNGSWFNAPSLLIPYRDVDGRLLSVQARYLGPKPVAKPVPEPVAEPAEAVEGVEPPRFQFPKGSRCGIFNLNILQNLTPGSVLFISEGVTDCLALLSSGRNAVAIPSATLLKESDARLLAGFSLHMIPDNDLPGNRLFLQLQKLYPGLIHHQLPSQFKDFGEYWLNVKC